MEALSGLGVAARYQLDAEAAITAHERAYRIARASDDVDAAALVAIELGYDAYSFRGVAEALGWIERAAMLVEGRPPSTASAVVRYCRAYLALLAQHDPESARAGSAEAGAIAREVGAVDVEMLALALEGLALVSGGSVDEGMRKLDAAAAAAIGGEVTEVDSIETVCCFVIDGCKRVRDLERANEWCERVREIATRFDDRQMFTVCRTHYADVLLWHGDWQRADDELTACVRELGRLRPGRDADALVRLAELRRRQGRLAEADGMLARSTTHRFHALVTGLIALDRGDAEAACHEAGRFLRRIGETDRYERIAGLELVVRASLARADPVSAGGAADEIAAIAATTPNSPLRASALLAEGRVAAAAGERASAAALLEDAADLFDAAGAQYDGALARASSRRRSVARGRTERARKAHATANETLRALGAGTRPAPAGPLSPREAEILGLVADRALERGDRTRARALGAHRRAACREHLREDRRVGTHGSSRATSWAHAHGIA